jgi:hypothetical protein
MPKDVEGRREGYRSKEGKKAMERGNAIEGRRYGRKEERRRKEGRQNMEERKNIEGRNE